MARERGPSFAQRVAQAGLTPVQREAAGATLLLAEIVAELLDVQYELLAEIRDQRPRTDDSSATPVAPTSGEEGGADVRLREPAVPPSDPDDNPGTSRAGAGASTSKASARRASSKASAGKAPAKAAAARRGDTSEEKS